MVNCLRDFWNDIARRKRYWMPVLFFAIVAYGFSIVNKTVSIDDLNTDYYLGEGKVMLSATRWGMVVWMKLLSIPVFMPFVRRFLAVCFFIAAAMVLSAIAHKFFACKSTLTYTVFSCIFVSYPLILEIFEFDGANMIVGVNMLVAALALLAQTVTPAHGAAQFWLRALVVSLPLTLVVSSYEAGAFFYVTTVCIFLFCRYVFERKDDTSKMGWLKDGIALAVPLVIAVILRIVIGFGILRIMNLTYAPNGEIAVFWGRMGLKSILYEIFSEILTHYVERGLVYFPITIFVIAALLFVIVVVVLCCRRRRVMPLVLGGVVGLSLFFQVIFRGGYPMPYRTNQTLGLFVAFLAGMVVEWSYGTRRPVYLLTLVVSFFLCLYQATYLNQMLSLNHLRSDNEIAVAQTIGYRLKTEFEDKPVVFTGEYNMGEFINAQVRVDPDSLGGGYTKSCLQAAGLLLMRHHTVMRY